MGMENVRLETAGELLDSGTDGAHHQHLAQARDRIEAHARSRRAVELAVRDLFLERVARPLFGPVTWIVSHPSARCSSGSRATKAVAAVYRDRMIEDVEDSHRSRVHDREHAPGVGGRISRPIETDELPLNIDVRPSRMSDRPWLHTIHSNRRAPVPGLPVRRSQGTTF